MDKTKENEEYTYETEVDLAESDSVSSSYLDDDEAFLNGDDVILSQKEALSIFQQSENVVSYEILNFFDEKGKARNSFSLRNDPPILHITSSDQQSADFVLTQKFVHTMAELLKNVDRAYMGVSPKKNSALTQEGVRSRFDSFLIWVKENKIKAGLLSLLIVLTIVYSFVSFS